MSSQAAIHTLPTMTIDEFLAWNGGGHVGKLELVDGIVRAMAPASATHAIIQLNIGTAITTHLRKNGSPCRAGTEAPIIPPMSKRTNARAPDVSVSCAPTGISSTFEKPVLIVEVISPGNEAETWESIRALAGLPSLQEILVVQSTRVGVQLFRRGADGAWPSDPVVADAGGTVHLTSIDMNLPVAEIYRQSGLAE